MAAATEHHHRGGARGVDEQRHQVARLDLAVDEQADQQRVHRRHHGRLGRREDAAAQSADDDDGQHQRPARLAQRRSRAPQGWRGEGLMAPCLRATQVHTATSVRPIIRPGAMPAKKSLVIDTLVATPKMMKEIDGGMMGAMMPPAAIRPEAGRRRSLFAQHGDQQRAERGGVGHRRAGQRRQQHAGEDGHIAQATLDVADEHAGRVDDAARDAAGIHQLAGQHEQRHGHQREAVGAGQHVLRQDLGIEEIQLEHHGDRAEQQREGDGHAQGDQPQQHDQEDGQDHLSGPGGVGRDQSSGFSALDSAGRGRPPTRTSPPASAGPWPPPHTAPRR